MNHPVEYHRGLTIPVVGLPLEGQWMLTANAGQATSFPLTNVPFRIVDMTLDDTELTVYYDLSQYWVWLPFSGICLVMFIGLLGVYRKRQAIATKAWATT